MTQEEHFSVKKTPVILMIIFDILTLGIYSCCWFLIRRADLNKLSSVKKLGMTAFILCLLLSVVGIFILIASGVFYGIGEALEDVTYIGYSEILDGINKGLDFVVGITLLVQSFKAKSMIEEYSKKKNKFAVSLSGAATFFFRHYYLQYRINKIHKEVSNRELEPTPLDADGEINAQGGAAEI